MVQNKFAHSVLHGVIAFIAFAIPLFISSFPQVANLTIGGLLVLGFHFLEHWAEE